MSAAASKLTVRNKEGIVRMQLSCSLKIRFFFGEQSYHPCTCLPAAYSTFYIIGLILSMQIPFVGFQPIRTSEHMAAAGQ